jgi:hypothetical protein
MKNCGATNAYQAVNENKPVIFECKIVIIFFLFDERVLHAKCIFRCLIFVVLNAKFQQHIFFFNRERWIFVRTKFKIAILLADYQGSESFRICFSLRKGQSHWNPLGRETFNDQFWIYRTVLLPKRYV